MNEFIVYQDNSLVNVWNKDWKQLYLPPHRLALRWFDVNQYFNIYDLLILK